MRDVPAGWFLRLPATARRVFIVVYIHSDARVYGSYKARVRWCGCWRVIFL